MIFNLLVLFLSIRTAACLHLSLKEKIDISIDEAGSDLQQEWAEFQRKYDKRYSLEETEFRFVIFRKNYEIVKAHNLKYDLGQVSYYLAINKFADLDDEEFMAYKGLRMEGTRNSIKLPHFLRNIRDLPSHVDWRTKKIVTGVKNQGMCGSCYAFSAVGSIEGQFALKNKTLVSFSEQNLVDCSTAEGNKGCEGGLMSSCYQYVHSNHGLDTEEQYSYTGKEGKCKYKKNPLALAGYVSLPTKDEKALQQAVATVGPVSVAIDATFVFQLYGGGVLDDFLCNQKDLNHGVLVVGYGVEDNTDYWLVKNSWGSDWGLEGYVKMSRNKGNQCGIATDANYPIV